MSDVAFALFETAVGRCGIAWGTRGIVGVQLPEARALATRARLCHRFPGAAETTPPAEVQHVIDRIVALLDGVPSDLADVPLDLESVPEFHRRIYAVARTIAPGTTLTYGEIAARVGDPGAAQAVGQAMGANPCPVIVPCHRVVAAGGKLGGFSAAGGTETKRRMLEIEGAIDRRLWSEPAS